MAYLVVAQNGLELIWELKPWKEKNKDGEYWVNWDCTDCVALPKGTIAKLIGRELTWSDEPYELK